MDEQRGRREGRRGETVKKENGKRGEEGERKKMITITEEEKGREI